MKIQYKKLVWPIAALIIVFMLAVVAFYVLNKKQSEQATQLRAAEQTHLQAQARLESADKDLRLYKKYEARYEKFEKMGLFNQEDRANLTENILKAGKKAGVFNLKMQLTPQSIMPSHSEHSSNEKYLSDAQWRRTQQKISFTALHEIEALTFFKSLGWNARLQQFEQCEFNSQKITLAPNAQNIAVSCDLNWSTLYLLSKENQDAP